MVQKNSKVSGGFSSISRDKRLTLADRKISLRDESLQLTTADFTIRFLERVVEEDPSHEEALHILGHVYTARGDYEKGLEVDRRLVYLRPEDPTAFYNLACSYSLLSQVDAAYAALEKALGLGFAPVEKIETDSDLKNLRASPRFKELIRKFGSQANEAADT